MAHRLLNMGLFVANAILPLALYIFCSGFFPYKPILSGVASFNEQRPRPAIFDKVIIMVVDALRSDFVYSKASGFLFTQSLIRSGAAQPYTARADSPTVTMPRVKAITTGSVPSFSDIILNVAESDSTSSLAHQDNLLTQFKTGLGKRMIMYGDDTWLRLFPETFDRFDGTTSFFVSDFVEVDNNVTRHLPHELALDDWSAMVLHYLGLDHIGHKAGPRSPHMFPKQLEMDSIVREIYTAILQEKHLQSTLLVLCGDHGMNDIGNHGGSSPGETSPALVFISPLFEGKMKSKDCPTEPSTDYQYYELIQQSDITPTLAGMLGVPIPLNNLGVFVPSMLDMWNSSSDRLNLLLENSEQVVQVVNLTFPAVFNQQPPSMECNSSHLSELEELACLWLGLPPEISRASNIVETSSSEELLIVNFLKKAQKLMQNTASNYQVQRLYGGCSTAVVSLLILASVSNHMLRMKHSSASFLIIILLGYGGMMFASSYVEEEQQFWYWMSSAWMAILHVKFSREINWSESWPRAFSMIFLAASHRVIRRWNQTGQKFAGEDDIARGFLSQHRYLLWALVFIAYCDNYRNLSTRMTSGKGRAVWRIVCLATTLVAFGFKLSFTAADSPELFNPKVLELLTRGTEILPLVMQARVAFWGIAMLFTFTVWKGRMPRMPDDEKVTKDIVHEILTLLLLTQSRSTNIPLYILFRAQRSMLTMTKLTGVELTVTLTLSQYTAFFAFGGSNAISSIDLSSAYNGVSSYNAGVVGVLTFLTNWAGPIWWISASRTIHSHRSEEDRVKQDTLLTIHVALSLLSVMIACTILRAHLFIWTVFSPKLLYIMAWTLGNHFLVNILTDRLLSYL